MHTSVAAGVAVLAVSTGCLAGAVRGSGHVVTETREVPAFDGVQAGGAVKVTVEIGPPGPIEVRADDNLLPLLETTVEGGRLQIRLRSFSGVQDAEELRVKVRAPAIHYLGATGASEIRAEVQRGDALEIEAHGAARVRVSGIDVSQLTASGSGGSEIDLAGAAQELGVDMSGATRVAAAGLDAREVRVHGSGGSSARIHARDTVRGHLSGASSLHVTGKASSRVSTSGASSVEFDD